MRKLLTIAMLWVAAPALSMAVATPGSFESLAQATGAPTIDAPAAVLQRPATVGTVSMSNYSLTAPNRGANTGGLKTQAIQSNVSHRVGTPVSFADGTAVDAAHPEPVSAVAPEVDASVSTPIPEPQTYALMIAGLVALGFMAVRRGRG